MLHLIVIIAVSILCVSINGAIENHEKRLDAAGILAERAQIESCREKFPVNKVSLVESASPENDFFQCFHPYSDIEKYLGALHSQNSDLLTKFPISMTVENRTIYGYTMTSNKEVTTEKTVLYVQGGIHAREWLSPPTVLYAMAKLMSDYKRGTNKHFLDDFVWHFVPVLNIDGYKYSWEHDRYWRKNRKATKYGSNIIYGVDLNRNYGPADRHCGRGSSTYPGSQAYCGKHAFSEPEVFHVEQWMQKNKDIKGSVDVHTYGSVILVPRAGANTNVEKLAKEMASKITKKNNEQFTSRLTTTYGTFKDYQYASYSKRPSYTMELRGSDFVVPEKDILASGTEAYEGFKHLATFLRKQH